MDLILGIIEQGLIYSFLALGIYITFHVLNFPDLTVDGSFALGGAIAVSLVVIGLNPLLAVFAAILGGLAAGCLTGMLHVKFGISDFLAGVIVQIALYTVNLLIAGSSYVAIYNQTTIFNGDFIMNLLPNMKQVQRNILLLLPLVILIKVFLDFFFQTKAGFLLKAAGDNPTLVKTMAKDPGNQKIIGLAMANGLVALGGALLAFQQGFFEVTMGTGAMVMGLASFIIGMKIFCKISFIKATTAAIFGSILYKCVLSLAMAMGFPANALKLLISLILFVILVLSKDRKKKVKYADLK